MHCSSKTAIERLLLQAVLHCATVVISIDSGLSQVGLVASSEPVHESSSAKLHILRMSSIGCRTEFR